jgi:toxin ParE1/3/4
MNRKLVLSNFAQIDLANIHDYIAEHNDGAAARVVDRIEEASYTLLDAPFTGSLVGSSHPDLRFRVVGKYVIYYRVTDDKVWIQRVLHGSQDARKLL